LERIVYGWILRKLKLWKIGLALKILKYLCGFLGLTGLMQPPSPSGFCDLPVTGSFSLLELEQLFGPYWNLY
jgi:hypothetical protein